jgi:predicted dehydrogenase
LRRISDTSIKIGIIGFGKMGLLHASILNFFPQVNIVAICEKDNFLISSIKKVLPNVVFYNNYKDMISSGKVDVIYITTPVHLHIPIALDCAKNEIPFFVEKPLALNSNEAVELVEYCSRNNIKTGVGFFMRFIPTYIQAKNILNENVLGELFSFSSSIKVSQLFKTGKSWRYEKSKSGGGVLIGQGIHLIDLLSFIFGDVEKVNGFSERWYSSETEDHAYGTLVFKSGLQGTFDSNWSIRDKRVLTTIIEIHGKNGMLYVDQDQVKLWLDKSQGKFKAGWTILNKPVLSNGVQIDIAGPEYTIENEEFINSIISDKLFTSDISSAFNTQKIVDAIYKSSSKSGKSILISEVS